MVKVVVGSLLDAKENFICHQVNCKGIMGGGIALQLRNKYKGLYEEYKDFCDVVQHKLGKVSFYKVEDEPNKYIINLFAQSTIGRGVQTDYDALRGCLETVRDAVEGTDFSVALPYNIGCGLAGGDWDIVSRIIDEVFKETEVVLYRYDVK